MLSREINVTGIVLAGGGSSRLGREKSRELIGGESLIGIVVSRLSVLSNEILIVVSQNQSNSSFPSCVKAKMEANLRVAEFPNLVRTGYVEKEEIDRFDPEHLSFFNINTQADLERARILALQGIPTGHFASRWQGGG